MIFRAFTFGVAATVGISLGIWTIDREPPTTTNRVEVITPEVPPGGKLRIHYWVRRMKECAIRIDRMMIDSTKVRVVLPDIDFERPPGPIGDDDYVSEVDVPDSLTEGPAIYRAVFRYNCNLIHRWFWPVVVGPVDVQFTVKGPKVPSIQLPELRSPR